MRASFSRQSDVIDKMAQPWNPLRVVAWLDDLSAAVDRLLKEEIVLKSDDFTATMTNLEDAIYIRCLKPTTS